MSQNPVTPNDEKICFCGKPGEHADHVANDLFRLLNEPDKLKADQNPVKEEKL